MAKESRPWSPEICERSKDLPEYGGFMRSFVARGFYSRNKVAFAIGDIGNGCAQTFHGAARTADAVTRLHNTQIWAAIA